MVIVSWVKEHPYLTGGTVLGGFILYLMVRNSGGGGGSSAAATGADYSSLQASELAAGLQSQQSYLAAQSQVAGVAASVAQTQLQTDAANYQAALQAGVQQSEITAGAAVSSAQIDAALKLGLAQTAAPLALAGVTGQVTNTPTGIIFGATQNSVIQTQTQTQNQATIDTLANVPPAPIIPAATPVAPSAPGGLPGSGNPTLAPCASLPFDQQWQCVQGNDLLIQQSGGHVHFAGQDTGTAAPTNSADTGYVPPAPAPTAPANTPLGPGIPSLITPWSMVARPADNLTAVPFDWMVQA